MLLQALNSESYKSNLIYRICSDCSLGQKVIFPLTHSTHDSTLMLNSSLLCTTTIGLITARKAKIDQIRCLSL